MKCIPSALRLAPTYQLCSSAFPAPVGAGSTHDILVHGEKCAGHYDCFVPEKFFGDGVLEKYIPASAIHTENAGD